MFRKILIANRGEIAVRIIRACRDLDIVSVAIYSEADREALHAQIADEAICVGPAQVKDSYLHMERIISAALASGAQAIHPGFGFLAENAEFASLVQKNGLVFIGPSPDSIRMLGDKVLAKKLAAKAGVPIVPGTDEAVADVKEAEKAARKIGFPLMLKAAAGGGGKGIRLVYHKEELKNAFETAASEAQANFGDGRIYMERYIENPRHIEVQILGDKHNVIHLFERECSVQRRHQKMLEEAPSSFVDEKLREKMGQAAVRLAKNAGYYSAGTVEFLVDHDKNFYFCEMNTRIQVEHPVTEAVTGCDLICEQIRIASGEPLSLRQKDISLDGHAIECRICAEDASRDFAPCPGTIASMHLPGGIGVRVDTAAYQGYHIPPYYDSMIGKLIVKGRTRQEAIARMRRALAELLFEGVVTSSDYHMKILQSEAFVSGNFHTNSVEQGDFDR